MATKHKNVDSIATVKTENVEENKETKKTLLSIIEPGERVEKKSFLVEHKKALVRALGALLITISVAGLFVGGAYAYDKQYESRVFPGVTVWGEDMGGKNVAELQEAITAKTSEYKLTIKGPDQDYTASAEDLGVIYNSEAMITSAFEKGRNGTILEKNILRIRLAAAKIPSVNWRKWMGAGDLAVTPTFNVNQALFDSYVAKISENINITAQDSEVKVAAGRVELKPAIYGRKVDADKLKVQIRKSIDGFSSEEIELETTTVAPAIIDTAAQEVMVQAQNVMKRPVVLTYKGVDYRPNQETVASWITFTKTSGEAKYTLLVDPAKMKGYFDYLGTKINVYSISRKVRVENEVKETETRPGVNGTLIDTTMLGSTIASLLPNQASVTTPIPTYVANYKTEYDRVIIADWDKYIDVNISTQTMTACERGGVNCKAWRVMTGKSSTPTPVGTWLVYARSHNFWMSGLEGTPDYYRLWVPYATWFKGGGYAIHSASWRNNNPDSVNGFGNQSYTWNGSHGCVNSPDDAAAYIYNWAPAGTPVIVHY